MININGQDDPYIILNNINTSRVLSENSLDLLDEDYNHVNDWYSTRLYDRPEPFLKYGDYTGDYQDNKFHGKGVFVDNVGNRYEGTFKYGYLHGRVKISYVSGSKYIGSMKYDNLDGYGKYIYNKKCYYIGDFCNGQKEGFGVYKFENGDKYEGEFYLDSFCGFGKMVYKNNSLFKKLKGEWINGQLEGKGEITYRDNSYYDGMIKSCSPHGEGKLYFSNKKINYSGNFLNGKYHDRGVLYDIEGKKIYVGNFEEGVFDGYGEEFLNDELIYYGYYKDGKKNGAGKIKKDDLFEEKFYIDGKEWKNFDEKVKECIENEKCPICMGGFNQNKKPAFLGCKHYFHQDCLRRWVKDNKSCPICRSNIDFAKGTRKRKLIVYHDSDDE